MHMLNRAVAHRLERLARLLEIRGDPDYKVRAYLRAAETLLALPEPITRYVETGTLTSLPGIGPAIAGKIREFLETGQIRTLRRVEAEVPPTLLELLNLPGLGPARVRQLWKQLGVVDVDTLEQALRAGQVRALPGFGMKTEASLLQAVEAYRKHPRGFVLAHALELGSYLLEWLRDVPDVQRVHITGPARRWVPFLPQLDLLVATRLSPEDLLAVLLAHPLIERGEVRDGQLRLWDSEDLPVVVHFTPLDAFGTAWVYTTGSPAHWQALQDLAQRRGWSLTPQGLGRPGAEEPIPEEEALYAALGLPWIPPELREGRGEIHAAQQGALPDLLPWDDLPASLHVHTDWSDGAASLREMVEAALARGIRVLAITDHSPVQKVARGLSVERLQQQRMAIEALRAEFRDRILLLHGAEVDILADGSLDYPDEVLDTLDLVVASPHLNLDQDSETATARLLRAVTHPRVHILGHPRGRMWPRRPGLPVDMVRLAQAAAEHGTALEINAQPHRMDLSEEDVRVAAAAGAWLSINTDAHTPADFGFVTFGLALARRCWVPKDQVVNTWPTERLLAWLQSKSRSA